MTNLQDRLKALRRLKSITQSELAEAIGVSTPAISSIEVGRTAPEENLKKIAEYCKVNYNWLYKGTGEAPEGIEPIPTKDNVDPYRDIVIKELKDEVQFYRTLIEKLVGVAPNFPKSPNLAGTPFMKMIHSRVQLGDQLSKVA